MNFTLYTIQAPGVDLTASWEPGFDYAHPDGCHYAMVQDLGWPWWVWSFPRMDDFDCPPAMDRDWIETTPGTLWRLQVPTNTVRWCGINALCFGKGSLEECFHPTADACRVKVYTPEGMVIDTPQGLVRGPIKKEWVVKRGPVGAPFRAVPANVAVRALKPPMWVHDTLDRANHRSGRLMDSSRAF